MGIGLDLPAFIGQLVSFLVLLFVLSRFGYPPIRRVMEERARRIRDSVEQVEQTRAEYERVQSEAEQELARARQQAHAIMVHAGAARDRLLAEAREEAGRESTEMIDAGRAQIATERRIMIEQLRQEFADAAIAAAGAVIAQTLDADRHKELIAHVLDDRFPLEERSPE